MLSLKSTALPSLALLTLFLSVGVVYANELELRQLNVVFRHGDRAPETFPKRFPNDPHMRDSFHPMGPGGLTNDGKRRAYRLGEVLRNRYADFLAHARDHHGGLAAWASGLTRTKMSLQLVLAALYPPSPSSKWHDSLDWQPIPIQSYRFNEDVLFNQDKCEMFIDELARVKNLTEVQKKLNEFDGFLEDLRVKVGRKSRMTMEDILILHNNLVIENRMNLTMQPWMIAVLADNRLKEMRMLFYEMNSYTSLLQRLQSGFMLRQINEGMFKARNETSNFTRKVTLYSGHDKNIIGLLQSLNIYDRHFPEFGSALIFELLSQNEQYYVKILYYLGIPEEIKELKIPGCPILCPLDEYLNITKSAERRDEELNCKTNVETYFEDAD